MKKILIFALFALLMSGCAYKNANVSTTVDNAVATINSAVKDKPECKSVGDLCKKQIDTINTICNQEIKNEKDKSWNNGFGWGMGSLFLFLIGVGYIFNRFVKKI